MCSHLSINYSIIVVVVVGGCNWTKMQEPHTLLDLARWKATVVREFVCQS